MILPFIWVLALTLASPQFLFRSLDHHVINLPGLRAVNFCYEDWPIDHGRAIYSVFVMLVQFFVPLLTVTISYARIVNKLKQRIASASVKKREQISGSDCRCTKTNTLLMAIAIIFCVSWLPFNVYNIMVDFLNPFGDDTESMFAVYAACHLLGMSSACSNPVLYGWLNDNFRKEFLDLFKLVIRWMVGCHCHSKPSDARPCGSKVAAFQREAKPCKGRDGDVGKTTRNSLHKITHANCRLGREVCNGCRESTVLHSSGKIVVPCQEQEFSTNHI